MTPKQETYIALNIWAAAMAVYHKTEWLMITMVLIGLAAGILYILSDIITRINK